MFDREDMTFQSELKCMDYKFNRVVFLMLTVAMFIDESTNHAHPYFTQTICYLRSAHQENYVFRGTMTVQVAWQ